MEETETTNAVLKEMIIGLTKITDERLINLKDSLAEIKLLMQGFATKVELDDVKKDFNKTVEDIRKGFAQHNLDDKDSFGNLASGQTELKDTLLKWGAVFGTVLFILSFLSPVILKYWFHI